MRNQSWQKRLGERYVKRSNRSSSHTKSVLCLVWVIIAAAQRKPKFPPYTLPALAWRLLPGFVGALVPSDGKTGLHLFSELKVRSHPELVESKQRTPTPILCEGHTYIRIYPQQDAIATRTRQRQGRAASSQVFFPPALPTYKAFASSSLN